VTYSVKHSNLLQLGISCRNKRFYNTGPWTYIIPESMFLGERCDPLELCGRCMGSRGDRGSALIDRWCMGDEDGGGELLEMLSWGILKQNLKPVSSTVFYRVQCAYEYSAHLNFTMIFGKKNFYFSKIISQELIIVSLFIIKKCIHHESHLKLFLSYLPFIVCREYLSIIFNV
jgi:hypothetical protein